MKELDINEIEGVSGGSLYGELNEAYEAVKEFGSSFWASAKAAYGIE
ncbi:MULTISPECIES: hypothetical protein [Xanthomonas translucens group]|uniref:Bacteriocin n=1 Tax=Xanthomonas translucens pv. translucens TaxID=134875 RepID=A0ABW9KTE5_XANCT|nr:hypothetical protein [Xanthomonas translucens]MCC8446667.1 hypothetical protein [Xanthomonas translucens pv. translucens]MCT8274332.1 hypothetical protein [Xanthomonas translucens pv. translucens]MCT8278242.1 hypothetical protein [Xanthomonas translucens pv. translucens]MCT8285633.1 hypothetical protein [Xanthomonas translucens pv. translucens]MCT8303291.1 hypothetical protein [Xanthomonas translucens pv. translucens]